MPLKLGKMSIDAMLAELKRRNRLITKLNRKRAGLMLRISAIEAEIGKNGGEIKGSQSFTGKRPKNAQPLPDVMANVMKKDKPMSVAEIEAAVAKAGYKSVSSTFKTIIFQTLGRDKRFKKVSRGQYALR